MAKVSLNNIKTRFETGDRPTGADYVDLIDTLAAQSTDLGTNGSNEVIENNTEHTVFGIENQTTLETLNASQWRLVKYIVSISKTDGNNNKFFATELSVLIDGEDISVTEYGVMDNDGDIGTVDVSRTGDTLILRVTPNPLVKPVTARYARIGLKA
jgi:hypothetical protein